MDVTWKITEADRDEQGNIKLNSEPRALADLLPRPETSKQDARRQRLTRAELAGLAAFACLALAIIAYAWSVPATPLAPPTAAPTLVATIAPTVRPRMAPTAAPVALVGYFDYADPATAAPLTANQITRVIGQAGAWRLVDAGGARVWIAADQVPAGVPADSPLPDLTPRPPAPDPQPAAAPAAAPAVCSADTAPYRVERRVLLGTLPIGAAMGFSCTSAAEAETNADAHEAAVRQSYQATVTTKTSAAAP